MTNLSDLKLNHNSYISLHMQLLNLLRQLIVSGQWKHGDRLPSEPQFAKHLGISRTTVRIALQSAEVEGLIKRVVGRGTFVSYEPDNRGGARLIGYVTRNFHNNIHLVLLSSVETELRSAGCRVVFSNATNNNEEVIVLKQLLEEDIAGLIVWPNANPTDAQREIFQQIQALDIPIVFVDRFVRGIEADYVASDNYGGTVDLINHLVNLGHERILYLRSNINDLFPVDERQRGYEEALMAHGLHVYPPAMINSPHETVFHETDIHDLLDESSSAEITEQVIALLKNVSPLPTAIACVNDALAILTVRAIQQMGLRVPDDISVVGFDDISLAAYMNVPLTTMRQDAHEIGRLAVELLLDRLDGVIDPPRREAVPTRLQIRSSTSTPIALNDSLSQESLD